MNISRCSGNRSTVEFPLSLDKIHQGIRNIEEISNISNSEEIDLIFSGKNPYFNIRKEQDFDMFWR